MCMYFIYCFIMAVFDEKKTQFMLQLEKKMIIFWLFTIIKLYLEIIFILFIRYNWHWRMWEMEGKRGEYIDLMAEFVAISSNSSHHYCTYSSLLFEQNRIKLKQKSKKGNKEKAEMVKWTNVTSVNQLAPLFLQVEMK